MPFDVVLLIAVTIIAIIYAAPTTNSYYWKQGAIFLIKDVSENRELKCEYYGGNNTRCVLKDPDFVVEQNPGCFEELDKANITRVYCGLNCEESEETTVVTKKPQWSHQCSMFYTYNLERRRKDWYLWRSEACINSTITFEVSCGTHRDPRVFYFRNENLFEVEDAE